MEQIRPNENIEQIPLVEFIYNREKDIWCLLEKGPGGYFSPYPTKAYRSLIEHAGENPTEGQASEFIDSYLKEQNIVLPELISQYNEQSKEPLAAFKKRAEEIFGIQIPPRTHGQLTVNNRCPYDIESNMFYVTIASLSKVLNISMHELWHFYTWYKFGKKEKELGEISMKRYGDIKEALTVLLNPECANLLPEGEVDNGYPQHRELRTKIVDLWKQNPDIEFIWESIRRE